MSNILIIKHGSLGDLIQANGAMKDIKESFPNDKVLFNNPPYVNFMSNCPYINGVLNRQKTSKMEYILSITIKKDVIKV